MERDTGWWGWGSGRLGRLYLVGLLKTLGMVEELHSQEHSLLGIDSESLQAMTAQ